jgi:hypothetical protein
MALRTAQGPRGKDLTLQLSRTRNPVENLCAMVSKFQSAKIGDEVTCNSNLLGVYGRLALEQGRQGILWESVYNGIPHLQHGPKRNGLRLEF